METRVLKDWAVYECRWSEGTGAPTRHLVGTCLGEARCSSAVVIDVLSRKGHAAVKGKAHYRFPRERPRFGGYAFCRIPKWPRVTLLAEARSATLLKSCRCKFFIPTLLSTSQREDLEKVLFQQRLVSRRCLAFSASNVTRCAGTPLAAKILQSSKHFRCLAHGLTEKLPSIPRTRQRPDSHLEPWQRIRQPRRLRIVCAGLPDYQSARSATGARRRGGGRQPDAPAARIRLQVRRGIA